MKNNEIEEEEPFEPVEEKPHDPLEDLTLEQLQDWLLAIKMSQIND